MKRDEIVVIWSSRFAIRRDSSREDICRVEGAGWGGGEAMEVIVDAGVEGINEDSGLLTNPPPSELIIALCKT